MRLHAGYMQPKKTRTPHSVWQFAFTWNRQMGSKPLRVERQTSHEGAFRHYFSFHVIFLALSHRRISSHRRTRCEGGGDRPTSPILPFTPNTRINQRKTEVVGGTSNTVRNRIWIPEGQMGFQIPDFLLPKRIFKKIVFCAY